jgi:hypothetical protein
MKLTIQEQDYTSALDSARPLTIERKLNEPSICEFWLSLAAGSGLTTPARAQSIAVTGDDGTVYFTGYIAVSPMPQYAGLGITGPQGNGRRNSRRPVDQSSQPNRSDCAFNECAHARLRSQ